MKEYQLKASQLAPILEVVSHRFQNYLALICQEEGIQFDDKAQIGIEMKIIGSEIPKKEEEKAPETVEEVKQ